MRIRFQPVHGFQTTVIGGALGHEYSYWAAGQERDIPDDERILFQTATGEQIVTKAVPAILSAGPDFVDASTGVNPNYACSVCGKFTNAESFLQANTRVPYEDEDGNRLCVADYLARNPHHVTNHKRRGLSNAVVAEAEQIRAAAQPPAHDAAPAEAPAPPAPVPPAPVIEPAPTPPPAVADATEKGA